MAGLATHVDFGPTRVESIRGGIVVFPQAGRMAVGAHEVPVLQWTGPMQDVVRVDPLPGVEVVPALTRGGMGPGAGCEIGLVPTAEFPPKIFCPLDVPVPSPI